MTLEPPFEGHRQLPNVFESEVPIPNNSEAWEQLSSNQLKALLDQPLNLLSYLALVFFQLILLLLHTSVSVERRTLQSSDFRLQHLLPSQDTRLEI